MGDKIHLAFKAEDVPIRGRNFRDRKESVMNIIVQLIRKGWCSTQGKSCEVLVVGGAHCNNQYLKAQELLELFASTFEDGGREAVAKLVTSLNGFWSVVLKTPDLVFIAVDHVRSHQLLYTVGGEDICVFDDMEDFRRDHHLEFDEDSVQEYLSSGFVYGERTLFKGVDSLQAGEMAWLSDRGVERERYYRFHAINGQPFDPVSWVKKADDMFLTTFRRTLETIGDRRIAVPLSGGCDSRLIVNYLHRLGVENLITFSYGFPNNREAVIAKQISERLGYSWHFVEYDKGLREREIYDWTDANHNRYMCNGCNRPVKQDFHAIKELLHRGVIAAGDVIMPGYAFDLLAGSQLDRNTYGWCAASTLQGKDCNFFEHGMWRFLNRRIRRILEDSYRDLQWKDIWESWIWQERVTKFTNHNVHTYEAFGLNWRLPLWDIELVDFWMSIPRAERLDRKWFYEHLKDWVEPAIRDVPYYNIHASTKPRNIIGIIYAAVYDRTPNLLKHYARVMRNAFGLHPAAIKDGNPQSGPVGMRTDVRDRLLRALPGMNIKERLMRTHETSRGAYEAMVSLLQMVER